MGLGLFIVREIINGHHGSITVQSTIEAGTVFSVQLQCWPS
jgi:signal transduction histidine kinase